MTIPPHFSPLALEIIPVDALLLPYYCYYYYYYFYWWWC